MWWEGESSTQLGKRNLRCSEKNKVMSIYRSAFVGMILYCNSDRKSKEAIWQDLTNDWPVACVCIKHAAPVKSVCAKALIKTKNNR